MIGLLIFFGLLLLLVSSIAALHLARLDGRYTLITWALYATGGVYGLGDPFLVYIVNREDIGLFSHFILDSSESSYFIHIASAFILMFGLVLGWIFGRKAQIARRIVIYKSEWGLEAPYWILLLSGVIAQVIYSRIHGGLLGVFDVSMALRSGVTVENPYSFLQRFGGLSVFASFGFFGLLLTKRRISLYLAIGLIASFFFSLYVLYSWSGRVGIATYILTFVIALVLRDKSSAGPLFVVSILGFIFIVSAAYLFSYLTGDRGGATVSAFVGKELAFPFASFLAWMSVDHVPYRLFYDLVTAPLYLLPSSAWAARVETIDDINTALFYGFAKGQYGVAGSIPTDIITFGYLQAGILGVALSGLIFGFSLRMLQYLIDGIALPGVRLIFSTYVGLKIAAIGIMYAQPDHLVTTNATLLFSAILIVFFNTLNTRDIIRGDRSFRMPMSRSHS